MVKVGTWVNCYYPVHGRLNVLRCVSGKVVRTGKGPNGKNFTLQTGVNTYRTLSACKCVAHL